MNTDEEKLKRKSLLLTENNEFNPHITSFNLLVGAQPEK